jgi:C4-dicarboxylate-specific signal transduction histidine kinase
MHILCVEIGDLLRDVLGLAQSTLQERSVPVDSRIGEHVPAVLGDNVELHQVLLNPILNACESMGTNAAATRRIQIVVARDADPRCRSYIGFRLRQRH